MPVLGQLAAVVIYLLPVAVVVALYARRERALWEMAAAIPAAVAADLVGTLVLSRLVRLEVAAVATRVLWVAGGAAWFQLRLRRRGVSPGLPAGLDRRAVAALVVAAALALGLSLVVSRPYAIWDREQHIPIVSALRGQGIPFSTAFEPGTTFHYHFAGDVLAAMLQTFSFGIINASLGLSLAHDLMFMLIGISVALAMMTSGRKPLHVVALGVGAVLLAGPCVLRFGVGEPYLGYSYYALYIWGFRPHQHVAMLMFVGVAVVLLARAGETAGARGDNGWRGIGALALMFTLLPVTDEASTGVLGLCLGVAWLVEPRLLAPGRKQGALLLGALAVLFFGTNLLFAASLAPGGPLNKVTILAARSPGVQQPPLPLWAGPGLVALIADTVPVWTVLIAFLSRLRRRDPALQPSPGLTAFLCALAVVSIVGLAKVEVNGAPPESHRMLTAALFVFPLLGLLNLDGWRPGTFARTLVLAGLTLGAFSTLLWLSHYRRHPTPETHFRQRGANLHDSDCRALAGTRFGQRPSVVYVESSVFYAYAGCRPSFVAGQRADYQTMRSKATLGVPGLALLDREMVAPDAPVDAICPSGRAPGDVDPVCGYALKKIACAPEGSAFVRCPLSPADRRAILGPGARARP